MCCRLCPVLSRSPVTEVKLTLYGKEQLVRLRTVVAMARFLKGTLVRAVWCELYDADKQRWSKARLLLAFETELNAEEILLLYARRWGIEPLFHNLKRWWGVNNLWQQKRTVLELWMQIRSAAWTLVQLLSLVAEESFPIDVVARQTTTDRRSGGTVATNGIYRTFFQRQFQPEVLNIHLPQAARRPKITDVAALSAANGMNFVRFTPSCAIVRVTQGRGLDI